jgi:transposase-like protein
MWRLALNPDEEKDVIGLRIEQSEATKFRLKVVNELKASLEAITSIYPQTIVQTCI